MKIKTELLQNMVCKAIKGAGNNNMMPITELIGIDVNKDTLTLMTTDGSNQLRVLGKVDYDPLSGPQVFYTIVNADTFSKLVGKTTKEYMELTNTDKFLEIKGNGTYKLNIAMNEEGELVKFPDIKPIEKEPEVISANLLKNILNTARASIAKTMEVPFLTGYYISDKSISTDRQLVCFIKNGIKEPLLISSEMAELLQLVEGENVNLFKEDNRVIFSTSDIIISGKELEGKDVYPVQSIENLVSLDYRNSIKVKKQEILEVLDRMSLFVDGGDKNGVYLTFAGEGLIIRSQQSNAEEIIDYEGIIDNTDMFTCLADIDMLKSQIETISADSVEIHYGQDKSIKLVEGDCALVVSLLEKAG